MAFHFKRKEPVARAVRRLGCRGIRRALEFLGERDKLEAIHSVRKEVKKLRALNRLVQQATDKHLSRELNHSLREAARQLAASRDTYVKVQALQKLIGHFKGELRSRPFAGILI